MNNEEVYNPIAEKVFEFIEYTHRNIFLTGKAGTGKTTLLKRIKENSKKKMVVVAPTGVAAMNAKGTTINSLFQLAPGSFFPGDVSLQQLQNGFNAIETVANDIFYSKEKIKLFKELDLLIVDEVSMVRCDLLDMMDALLRKVRQQNAPFGGLQLLLIGDLYQLPPVIKNEEWQFLSKAYPSPYFFDSIVLRKYPILQIELDKVFRQTEADFIKVLNDIRNNEVDDTSLSLLNSRFIENYQSENGINPIVLTSHNAEANLINKQMLDALPGEAFTFDAEINGEFREMGLQAEQQLILKVGAQIMFIKNDSGTDRKYYNGKIGKVEAINAGDIYISFPGEESFMLEKSTWTSFEYKMNHDEEVSQQQVGEFAQYPIKLAWAVTIHKSQGLTFDHAIIDAGKSFVAGQVYVALSRVRTLSGLILKSKINKDSLRSNHEVLNYLKPSSVEQLSQLLIKAQEQYILQLILDHFNLYKIELELKDLNEDAELNRANISEYKVQFIEILNHLDQLQKLVQKFQSQVHQLVEEKGLAEHALLLERIEAAKNYFSKELNMKVLTPILKIIRLKAKNKVQQQIQHQLQKIRQHADNSLTLMHIGLELFRAPIAETDYKEWIIKNKKQQKFKINGDNNNAAPVNLQLF